MSEQAVNAPQDGVSELSDQQLIDGTSLVEDATNTFLNSTFEIKADDSRSADSFIESPSQSPTPQPEASQPEAEAADSAPRSPDIVELERQNAELRRQQRELEDEMLALDEEREYRERPSFRESAWDVFQEFAEQHGMRGDEAYERLTQHLLGEDKELIAKEAEEERWSQQQSRLEALENQLLEAEYQREEQELWLGLEDLVQELAETHPISASRGEQTVGDVFYAILNHYEDTGEVLDAREILQQYEAGLSQQIESLKNNDVIRQMLGLSAQQMNQPQHVSAREVVQGTPTLTNQSAGERSVLASVDELPDEDEMIRLASEAFLSG